MYGEELRILLKKRNHFLINKERCGAYTCTQMKTEDIHV